MSRTVDSSKLHRKKSTEKQSEFNLRHAEERRLEKGTPQIEICGDLVQEVLLEVIAESLEELVIYLRKERNDEDIKEDDKYRSYAAALRILK